MKHSFKKLDKYLYEYFCENYCYEEANDFIRKAESENYGFDFPACSTIRSGNYMGRNFDFFYGKMLDIIVKVPRTTKHFASVGVSCPLTFITTDNIDCCIDDDVRNFIPFCTWDGINENGVTFSTNVVPCIDLDYQTSGTNPCKPPLYSPFIGRFVLDYAKSARHAIELLKERNIITPKISMLNTMVDLHFMIADNYETYVVEFINNKLVYRRNEVLMTNFYVSIPMQPHSIGLERYSLLKRYYYTASHSINTMSNLMEKVHYSQAYNLLTTPFWYSEHITCGLADGIDITIFNMYKYKDYIKDHIKNIKFDRDAGIMNPWFTMHSSIYDIRHRKLRIYIQENYKKWYDFSVYSFGEDGCVED